MNLYLILKTDNPYYKHAIVNKYFKKFKVCFNKYICGMLRNLFGCKIFDALINNKCIYRNLYSEIRSFHY